MAFLQDGRVYYSGRIKDMIIVRGQNFYAQACELYNYYIYMWCFVFCVLYVYIYV